MLLIVEQPNDSLMRFWGQSTQLKYQENQKKKKMKTPEGCSDN